MLQKEIRMAINDSKKNDEGLFLNYQYDFSKVKEVLFENPTLIDSQDEEGNTLLHHLIDPKVVVKGLSLKEVLQFNPNPFIKNSEGFTPRVMLLSDESNVDKQNSKDVLEAYEQSYISSETGKIFQGIVLLMTKGKEDQTASSFVSYQEDLTVSILNLLGEGNKKLAYFRAQTRVGTHHSSIIKRQNLLVKTLTKE